MAASYYNTRTQQADLLRFTPPNYSWIMFHQKTTHFYSIEQQVYHTPPDRAISVDPLQLTEKQRLLTESECLLYLAKAVHYSTRLQLP